MQNRDKKIDSKFEKCELSKIEMQNVFGGMQCIHQAILRLVAYRLDLALEDTDHWHHADYRYFAYQSGVPINTLKRFANEGATLQHSNKQKLLTYLQYASWDDLVKAALEYEKIRGTQNNIP